MNAEERSRFRAFVRDNHPDRGGDPEAFVAGLARFGTASPADPDPDPDLRRFDAPVEVRTPRPFAVRVGVALIRTWHRHRQRRVR